MSAHTSNDNSHAVTSIVSSDAPVPRPSYDWMNAERGRHAEAGVVVSKAQFEAMLDQAQMRETMCILEQNAATGCRQTAPLGRGAPVQPHVHEAEKRYQQELLEALRVSQERWRLAQEMEEMQIYAATQLSLDRPRNKPP